MSNIIEKIESLPPLPKTIKEIEEFRKKPQKESYELLEIIEKDPLIISTLLKIANSAMFGFRSKVETPSRAINLLGVNFTISIAIGGTVQNLLTTSLEPYGINTDDFLRASNIATSLENLWLKNVDYDLKEELVLPTLLQETGKFIISDIILSNGKAKEFSEKIKTTDNIASVERDYTGYSTSDITAKIFKHWKLSNNLVGCIENVDSIEKATQDYVLKSKILNVLKTACDIRNPLNENAVNDAIKKSLDYGLDTKALETAITNLQDRLLDEV